MNLGGRPVIYTEEAVRAICDQFNEYIDNADIPIIAKFAWQNEITKTRLYEFAKQYEWFSYVLQKCKEKKESALEELALQGKINVTMAIFSLKQQGWTDKTQSEITVRTIDDFLDETDGEPDEDNES